MFKKFSFTALVLVLISSLLLVACTGTNTETTESSETESEATTTENETETAPPEPKVVKVLALDPTPPGGTPIANTTVIKEIEKRLNIKFEFELLPPDNYETVVKTRLSAGDLDADIFMTQGISLIDIVNSGHAEPLNNHFDSVLKNTASEIQRDATLKRGVTHTDGNIYHLPNRFDPVRIARTWNIRKDWLDELGLQAPRTPNELYNVLKAFKERDPDSIPYISNWVGYLWLESVNWYGMNIGSPWDFMGFDNDTGKWYPYPTHPQFKELMKFIAKLYKEKLITQDIATITGEAFTQSIQNGKVGLLLQNPSTLSVPNAEYVGMLPPYISGAKPGVRSYNILFNRFHVNPKGENMEDALRLIEYVFADPEGAKLWNLGIEGETYTIQDGKPVWNDTILSAESPQQALVNFGVTAQILPNTVLLPSLGEVPQTIDTNSWQYEAIKQYSDAGIVLPSPIFGLTAEEDAKKAELLAKFTDYTYEYLTQVVVGTKDIDKTWDEFQKVLIDGGIDEVASIMQTAYDRASK